MCGSLAYSVTAILSKTFFVRFTVALEIRQESHGPSYASVVLYVAGVYTSLISMQLRLTTKLTGLAIRYNTTNDGLTANDTSFNFQSWLATLYAVVSTYMYANCMIHVR